MANEVTLQIDCRCKLCRGATKGAGIKHIVKAYEKHLAALIIANGGEPVQFNEDFGLATGLRVAFDECQRLTLLPHLAS